MIRRRFRSVEMTRSIGSTGTCAAGMCQRDFLFDSVLPSIRSMLKLDKLEINGFKSFYDPAQLSFPVALTAVVGPNGCGKSNICDAIIWVLGENRASHIRGEPMEETTFQIAGAWRRERMDD